MDGFTNVEAIRTLKEVAAIMRKRGHEMSHRAVWHAERRALAKLRQQLIAIVCEVNEEANSSGLEASRMRK